MTTIRLKRFKRARPSGKVRYVWMLRWNDSNGCDCGETISDCRMMTRRRAEAIRRERQGKIDNGLVKPDKPKRMTLSQFKTHHAEIVRSEVSPRTLLEIDHAFKWAERTIGGIPCSRRSAPFTSPASVTR